MQRALKWGNLQPDYFCYVTTCMHELKYPEHNKMVDEHGEWIAGWLVDVFWLHLFCSLFAKG
jgi:hypothetical protein